MTNYIFPRAALILLAFVIALCTGYKLAEYATKKEMIAEYHLQHCIINSTWSLCQDGLDAQEVLDNKNFVRNMTSNIEKESVK